MKNRLWRLARFDEVNKHGGRHNQEMWVKSWQRKMCGILCSVWKSCENEDEIISDYAGCKCIIDRRGPDSSAERTEQLQYNWKARFAASVLWMQGAKPCQQPCVDSDGNVLLWNGDIFSGCLARTDVSDTRTLLDALRDSDNFAETLNRIRGPYSVVYYQAKRRSLYFARDPIGRHSLLLKISPNRKALILSSSACRHLEGAIELPAIGIFVFDLETLTVGLYPWPRSELLFRKSVEDLQYRLGVEIVVFDAIGKEGDKSGSRGEPEVGTIAYIDDILTSVVKREKLDSSPETKNFTVTKPEVFEDVMKSISARPEVRARMQRVLKLLKRSIQLRVEKKPNYCRNCVRSMLGGEEIVCGHAKLGILFSGGLDSTIVAALADEFVGRDESIDLINVAFEKARRTDPNASEKKSREINEFVNFDVPDRKTGRQALAELQEIRPWRRWNFVECNVTQEELMRYRSTRIRDLVYPLTTILDDSLGCALWFASRGSGILSSTGEQYESPCRILLLGMGADELFGGYTRHRTTLRRGGWPALGGELDAELARISERNLGRDDRVVSDHGRQSRLPYLDDDFVEYASGLEAWERCYPVEKMPPGLGDKLLLRLVARDIGLRRTAGFPKRAFQFGSRIANSKENAKDPSKWT